MSTGQASSRRRTARKPRLSRFEVIKFTNPRTGSVSYRVAGTGRDGKRVRLNFADQEAAQARQHELEGDYLGRRGHEGIRFTTLTAEQTKIAEAAFLRLDEDVDLTAAVDFWLAKGCPRKGRDGEHRLDDATEAFKAWLDGTDELRDRTKTNLRTRVSIFASTTGNVPLSAITPDSIDAYLAGRRVTQRSRKNDHLAISRFLSWCCERPRRWIDHNPARDVKVKVAGDGAAPEVLSLREVTRLLAAAKRYKGGRFAPYVATALFAGLRPTELSRLQWAQVNLDDGEIRLEKGQTKTKRPRVVTIGEPLASWLRWCDAKGHREFSFSNWQREFKALRHAAKLSRWPDDVLRHSAISHHFRRGGSYGLTAEWAGNSEAVIKAHYQGRVSSEETAKFWNLYPTREQRRAAIANLKPAPAPTSARKARANR